MRKAHLLLILGTALLALAAACSGPDPTPTPTPVPDGVLAGVVTIGPLCPIEPCDASEADVYSGREIILEQAGAASIELPLDAGGRFSGAIAPGTYVVRLSDCTFPGCDGVSPTEATIMAGETTTLTMDIDTGIRTPGGGGPLDAMLSQLRVLGVTVEFGDVIDQPFLAVTGLVVRVNGIEFQVFVYPTSDAAEADAAKVSPDGTTIGTTSVFWIGPPHFFRSDATLVLYVGSDATVLGLLTTAFGAQFAGATGLSDAGAPMTGGSLDLTGLSPELQEAALCLQQAFGEETFAQLLAGEYVPGFADLAKLGECDIDLALLTTLTSVMGGSSEDMGN